VADEQERKMLEKMFALGHRRIAAIGGPKGSWMNDYRLKTYERCMRENGVLDEQLVRYSPLQIEDGKRLALELLAEHPEVTAIYCINDVIAVGALQAAKQLELRVPDDLSILGSDGIPLIEVTSPPLSSISTPREEMGRRAVTMMLDMVEGKTMETDAVTLIPCTCIEGGSIAPPRKGKA